MKNEMEIWAFVKEHKFLSNFYVAPIHYMGLEFQSGEHLFNALKTNNLTEALHVISAPTPGIAKQRGRQVTLKPNWDDVERYRAMRTTVGAKFLGDPILQRQLLDTDDLLLSEGNTWHDNVWGDCFCGRPSCETPGENHLGKLLMELREDLRSWA